MDKILIRDLAVDCIIGTNPDERIKKQGVLLNIELDCDLGPAGASDSLADTVNYSDLCRDLVTMTEASSFMLIERLADAAARMCLDADGVAAVRVTVDKPGALDAARSVAVSIGRPSR
jgi:FolB domain-containing protein